MSLRRVPERVEQDAAVSLARTEVLLSITAGSSRTFRFDRVSWFAATVWFAHGTSCRGAVVALFAHAGGLLFLVVFGLLEENI